MKKLAYTSPALELAFAAARDWIATSSGFSVIEDGGAGDCADLDL